MSVEQLKTKVCNDCDCILRNVAFESFTSIIREHYDIDHDVICNSKKCCRTCGHLQKCKMSRQKVR